jgi:hypothetical protein
MPLPNTFTLGPFETQYHRELADGEFCDVVERFIRSRLASQVDHPIEAVVGSLTACFDEDRYCGPNSAVRNVFRLELTFRGEGEESTIRTDLNYDDRSSEFSPRRGSSLYVWTPTRRRVRAEHQNMIKSVVKDVLDGGQSTVLCPICGTELHVIDCDGFFDLFCPSRCFKYNFHRDEDGNPTHGHFFMSDPEE